MTRALPGQTQECQAQQAAGPFQAGLTVLSQQELLRRRSCLGQGAASPSFVLALRAREGDAAGFAASLVTRSPLRARCDPLRVLAAAPGTRCR